MAIAAEQKSVPVANKNTLMEGEIVRNQRLRNQDEVGSKGRAKRAIRARAGERVDRRLPIRRAINTSIERIVSQLHLAG
jgi:hypothetical protein